MKQILIILISILISSYLLTSCEKEPYVGEKKNGKYHGHGTYTYPNGDKYEGDWILGKRNGKGIYIYGKGEWEGDKYEGEWKNGNKNGHGTYIFGEGEWEGDKYEGEWKKGKEWNITEYDKKGKMIGKFVNGLKQ